MSLFVSIQRQVDKWQAQGLLDQQTADLLRNDIRNSKSGFSIGGVLAVLGSLLLGAALILFIAANWDGISRLGRVGLILSVMWGGYLGGAWLQNRNDHLLADIFAPALYLLSALTYGAGIALVGQMYHMSGDMTTAALAWGGGVLVAALLLRAPILCAAALGIGGFYLYSVWMELGGQINYIISYRWILPLYMAACAMAMLYTGAAKAMHLLAMLALAYLVTLYIDIESPLILYAIIVVGAVLVVLQGRWSQFDRVTFGFGPQLAGYGLALILIGLVILQTESDGIFNESGFGYSLAAIAATVLALIVAGEKSGQLRWFAYAGFSMHVLYLASVTVGTMIGTSGVFLIGGLLIMALAYLVTRMEKYLRHPSAGVSSASHGDLRS